MSRSTRKDLPHHVQDFKFETRILDSRNIIHFLDDPEAPPFAPKLEQHWQREKHPVGKGGQGRVYMQTCTKGPAKGTTRAVKTLRLQQDNQRQPYVNELSTITRFSHQRYFKYFVKTLGYYESRTKLHIAMDYYPAGDLQDHIQYRPRLPEADVRQIIIQVLAGLAVMHEQNYAHRDVKPRNILIQQHPDSKGSGSWWVKLADFGISKSLEADSGNTSTVVGTHVYMAPELEGRIKRSDINFKAADLWALGVTSFFISTKHDMFSCVRDVLRYEADPNHLFPNDILDACRVSTDGQDFIRVMTRPKPEDRPDYSRAGQLPWVSTPVFDLPDIPDEGSESSLSSGRSSLDEAGMTTVALSRDGPTAIFQTDSNVVSEKRCIEKQKNGIPSTNAEVDVRLTKWETIPRDKISSINYAVMEPFAYLEKYRVPICKKCGFACVSNEIPTHLRARHRDMSLAARRTVAEVVGSIPGVIKDQSGLDDFNFPPPTTNRVPFLTSPKPDGLKCRKCPYIVKHPTRIKAHCHSCQNWENPQGRGRPRTSNEKLSDELPWRENVLCQRFFPSRRASRWFEVSRKLAD